METSLADNLLSRVRVVADNPSTRVAELILRKNGHGYFYFTFLDLRFLQGALALGVGVGCYCSRTSFAPGVVEMLPAHLLPILETLRAAYPTGLPEEDYLPLLAALRDDLSDTHLAQVVAELVDGEVVVVDNDAAKIEGRLRPTPSEVERVRARLNSAGYEFDFEEGCSPPSAND